MIRGIAILAVAAAAVAIGGHAAFAGAPPQFCIFGICIGGGHGGGGGNPAPAPLLAAGIPAFTALGGGVLVSRAMRKFKSRA
jgi:hypothetical protein